MAGAQVVSDEYAGYPYLLLKRTALDQPVSKSSLLKNEATYLVDNVKLLLNKSMMPVFISTSGSVLVRYMRKEDEDQVQNDPDSMEIDTANEKPKSARRLAHEKALNEEGKQQDMDYDKYRGDENDADAALGASKNGPHAPAQNVTLADVFSLHGGETNPEKLAVLSSTK